MVVRSGSGRHGAAGAFRVRARGRQWGCRCVHAAPRRRGTSRCGPASRSAASYLALLPSSPPQLPCPLLAVRGARLDRLRSPPAVATARARPHGQASARQASGSELSHRAALAGHDAIASCPSQVHGRVDAVSEKNMRWFRRSLPFGGVGPPAACSTCFSALFRPISPLSRWRRPNASAARAAAAQQHVGPSAGAPGDGREG